MFLFLHFRQDCLVILEVTVLYYTCARTRPCGLLCSCGPVYTALVMFILWPYIPTQVLDSMLTVLTHLLHISWKMRKMFLGLLPSFFLQSRSAVLDCGHTPGQHAQCLVTPATHIQCFNFFLGSWLLASQQIAMVDRNLDINSDAFASTVA